MNCKIVYLTPQNGFRTDLRSDSLWGALCWGIRLAYSNRDLEEVIHATLEKDESRGLFISSAFPWEKRGNKVYRFLPFPFERKGSEPFDTNWDSVKEVKGDFRRKKKMKKPKWISFERFQSQYQGVGDDVPDFVKPPRLENKYTTHNRIDRLQGSTLFLAETDGKGVIKRHNNGEPIGRGQLFHADEYYYEHDSQNSKIPLEKNGLYFFAYGDTDRLEVALRILRHLGIGGDRTIGKGTFDFQIEDFEWPAVPDANALMNISLFAATQKKDLEDFLTKDKRHLLRYKLEERQGRTSFMPNPDFLKQSVTCLKEGSVFPIPENGRQHFVGSLPVVDHKLDHDVYHYGIAWLIPFRTAFDY
jgi:CRISPR-associated protein Csm4